MIHWHDSCLNFMHATPRITRTAGKTASGINFILIECTFVYAKINNTTGFSTTTALGFEFKMTKALSIALETRLRLIYTKTINDIDNLYDSAGTYRRQDEQFQFKLWAMRET